MRSRGWGRSVTERSQRGLCGSTERVINDVTSFLQTVLPSDVPLFLMGHSMGGAEVMVYAAQGPVDVRRQIHGYLAESPFISMHPSTRPYRITVLMGRLASKLMPNRQLVKKLDPKLLSRDPVVQRQFVEDELCHDTGTLESLAGMLDRAAGLLKGSVFIPDSIDDEGIKVRLWVSHGTHDGVCDFAGTKQWFESVKVKDKTFKVYDGWYHKCMLFIGQEIKELKLTKDKVHAEPDDDKFTFANDVAEWVLSRSLISKDSDGSEAVRSKL